MGRGCPDINRRPVVLAVRTNNYNVAMDVYLFKNFNESIIKEIYDLQKDPMEKRNLYKNKKIKSKINYELDLIEKRFNELKKTYKK